MGIGPEGCACEGEVEGEGDDKVGSEEAECVGGTPPVGEVRFVVVVPVGCEHLN